MVLPFFPARLILRIAGPEETKNLSGEKALRLIQIRFDDDRVRVVGRWDFSRTFLWLHCVAYSAWVGETGRSPESPLRSPVGINR